jgi:hypothetical protein
MKKKIVVIAALVFAAGAIGVGTFVSSRAPQRKLEAKADPPPQGGGLEQPSAQIERPVAPSETPTARPTPPPAAPVVVTRPAAARPAVAVHEKAAPVRIYTAASYTVEAPKLEAKEEDPAPYAPAFRLVRCQLFNTLESSNIQTPIIGKVTDEVVWGGEVVIPKCTEVHGMAQVGPSKDRIVSEGPFTFVLQDGRQLTVKGIALDRGYDPAFKTYAVTEASAGILGSVIKNDNAAEIKLFVATFISGVAQGLKGTSSGLIGPYENPNARGAGGLPGYVINPTTTATQSVLDQYAQRVLDGIVRDGYYVVVPASKQFNVYVTQDIDLSKATVHGDRSRTEAKDEYLKERKVDEELTESRADREASKARDAQNAFPGVPAYPQMDQMAAKVESTGNRLEARSKALGKRVDELNAQAEAQQ